MLAYFYTYGHTNGVANFQRLTANTSHTGQLRIISDICASQKYLKQKNI